MKTNKNSVRRNLIISATALMLSIAMLIGTTFAWFTDSVTSGRNHIQAGNLDVELKYKNKTTTEFADVTTKTQLFDDSALWEPGHVEYVVLNVHNAGTLALKYNLNVTVDKETEGTSVETNKKFKLSSFLQYAAVPGDLTGKSRSEMITAAEGNNPTALSGGYTVTDQSLLANSDDDIVTLVVWMPEETGNAANYTGNDIPTIELGLTLVATQYTEESDSFDNTYDKDAKYPAVGSVTAPVENGIVKSDIEIETTEKLESDPTSPVARALIPAKAKTTAAKDDTSTQLVLRVEEASTATIDGVNTFERKLRTLDVTMDGLAPDNDKIIRVELYVGKNLEDFQLYHNKDLMWGVGNWNDFNLYWNLRDEDPDSADHVFYYDADTGYVTFTTMSFASFTLTYKGDVWSNHVAETFSQIDNTEKTITITSAEELALFAKNLNAAAETYNNYTIQIANDIDLGSYLWEPIKAYGKLDNVTINGNGHTIRNMIARGSAGKDGYACGFIGNTSNPITIKNLNFDNADTAIYTRAGSTYVGNIVGIVIGDAHSSVIFDTVSVINSTVSGYGKVGCLLGMGAEPGVSITFKDCISKDNTIHATYNVGGLAGNIQRGDGKDNASAENCKVENIVFDSDPNSSYIELNNASAIFRSNDKPDGTTLPPKPVSGTYWVCDGYYWGGYADYYVSYGDSTYDAPVEGYETKGLANGEYCVNK